MSTQAPSDDSPPVPLTNGRVKWFNNKAGYGFITVASGEAEGTDVFVHHSSIQVSQEQYRYLVQGEYIDFELSAVENNDHKWQASNVRGVNNGKLMCETRLDTRNSRTQYADNDADTDTKTRRPTRPSNDDPHYRVRSRGQGPREGDEWMLVRRRPSRQSATHTSQQNAPSSPQQVLRGRGPKH